MQLASHLGVSLQRVQQETTSTEFIDWMIYLERDSNRFRPEFYYLAQIAQEVRRVLHKHPDQVELNHFLLKFGETAQPPQQTRSPEEVSVQSKANWFAMVGFKKDA